MRRIVLWCACAWLELPGYRRLLNTAAKLFEQAVPQSFKDCFRDIGCTAAQVVLQEQMNAALAIAACAQVRFSHLDETALAVLALGAMTVH
ncbi:hypothetical protein So717_42090 [Roseobacter cerasinus]|uniref:Uncharacterized protein n=1 Tax=Roseobacter cerasinus TaxID=2602289 RepID=A0A640W1U4_9RHOB|nr:hypothetical protein So717_42090 [Roseobacter cerasinus]